MNHFEGINNTERFNNDLIHEIRKTNQLLEQLISTIQPVKNVTEIKPIKPRAKPVKKPQPRRKKVQ